MIYFLWLQVDIDFEKEPIGTGKDGKSVFLRDIWPTNEEVAKVHWSHTRMVLEDIIYSDTF